MKDNKEKFEKLIEKACELCNKNEYKKYKETKKRKKSKVKNKNIN